MGALRASKEEQNEWDKYRKLNREIKKIEVNGKCEEAWNYRQVLLHDVGFS